ncbi:MAG: pseudoazurin [Alphaproteobacteria bacterium HGW-Alphaproteobacteria-5]|nr:MAG: pseudoazurin [Alphaproteobacteria bacterium HGW-Alphaproteobacteria-5]
MRIPTMLLGAATALALMAPAAPLHASAPGKSYTVKMLDKGKAGAMVFEPAMLRIKPGDSVTFTVNDMGHNAETIPGMLPPGAKPFKGAMNKPVTITLTQPGVYGYKCLPHLGMGMVGVIVVGDPVNLAETRKVVLPGKSKKVMADLLAGIK